MVDAPTLKIKPRALQLEQQSRKFEFIKFFIPVSKKLRVARLFAMNNNFKDIVGEEDLFDQFGQSQLTLEFTNSHHFFFRKNELILDQLIFIGRN